MFLLGTIIWALGILLLYLGKYEDNRIVGRLLTVIGPGLLCISYLLNGLIMIGICLGVFAILDYTDMKKDEITYGLSWHYALRMTARRIVGDL